MESGQTQAHARHQLVSLSTATNVRVGPGSNHSLPLPPGALLRRRSLCGGVAVGGVSGMSEGPDGCAARGRRGGVTPAEPRPPLVPEKSRSDGGNDSKVFFTLTPSHPHTVPLQVFHNGPSGDISPHLPALPPPSSLPPQERERDDRETHSPLLTSSLSPAHCVHRHITPVP